MHVNIVAQDTLLRRRRVMELVSFMSDEAIGGEWARWQARCHSPGSHCNPRPVRAAPVIGWETWPVLISATGLGFAMRPCCYYGRFTQLDVADDNGSVALGVVDEAHAVLWYSRPAVHWWLTERCLLLFLPVSHAPTTPSGNLLPHLLLFMTMTLWSVGGQHACC